MNLLFGLLLLLVAQSVTAATAKGSIMVSAVVLPRCVVTTERVRCNTSLPFQQQVYGNQTQINF